MLAGDSTSESSMEVRAGQERAAHRGRRGGRRLPTAHYRGGERGDKRAGQRGPSRSACSAEEPPPRRGPPAAPPQAGSSAHDPLYQPTWNSRGKRRRSQTPALHCQGERVGLRPQPHSRLKSGSFSQRSSTPHHSQALRVLQTGPRHLSRQRGRADLMSRPPNPNTETAAVVPKHTDCTNMLS